MLNINESKRSKNPPCPGKMFDASFRPTSRFIPDSKRSPIVPIAPIPNVINSTSKILNDGTHNLLSRKVNGNVRGNASNVPSHDFFGLTLIASLCLPKPDPMRYANVSYNQVNMRGTRAMPRLIFLRGIMAEGSSDMYIAPNAAAVVSAKKLGSRREPGNRITDRRQMKKKKIENGRTRGTS